MFTDEQKRFLVSAQEWLTAVAARHHDSLQRDERFALLTGFPGTGKSTVVVELIKRVQSGQGRVLLTAPTHFAKNVLANLLNERGLSLPVSTIHSVLGIKSEINAYGDESFTQSKEPIDFSEYDLLIVDEASMINRYLWATLATTPSLPPTLFVGDRHQLRPVNCSVSPVFSMVKRKFSLTQVVRHQGLLVDYLAALRDRFVEIDSPEVSPADFMGDDTVIYCDYDEWLARISATMQSRNSYKVLAYTNKNVDRFNALLRRIEVNGYDIPKALEDRTEYSYAAGEKLILREALLRWNSDKKYEEVVYNNGTTLNVARVVSTVYLGFRCSLLNVWCQGESESSDIEYGTPSDFRELKRLLIKEASIYVLEASEVDSYQARLSQLKAQALAHPAISGQRKEAFRGYYQLKKAFTDVSRINASTVHKAQGATLDVVFLYSDVLKCTSEETRKELQYVGASRAKKQLVICSEDNSDSFNS